MAGHKGVITATAAATNAVSFAENRGMGILPMLCMFRMGKMPMPRKLPVLPAAREQQADLIQILCLMLDPFLKWSASVGNSRINFGGDYHRTAFGSLVGVAAYYEN
ncbi:MAG: hypothetical protein WCH98_16625 [Verrucomicrobiota bacterium]